ncbi:MAG: hypothetical protein ABIZ80_01190, partial [Bryobacteraceae bacterium]
MKQTVLLTLLCAACYGVPAVAADAAADPIMRAMRDELARSRELKVPNLESPYYVEYAIDDVESFSVSATFGGLVNASRNKIRVPRVEVRVGSYQFDNTNYVGSSFTYGSNYDVERFPLDNDYPLLRRYLWLATDRAYKSAVESIARKRAALKNISAGELPADFAKTEPLRRVEDLRPAAIDEAAWKARVRALSAVFLKFPALRTSSVELEALQNTHYMITSEGTEVRVPEKIMFLRARAASQAADGMILRDAVVFHTADFGRMASDEEMAREIARMSGNIIALTKAPRSEGYSGPVLFEKDAAAQLFAQLLGKNFSPSRRPV